jgi:cytochrome b subunit of formate dehydrogenase
MKNNLRPLGERRRTHSLPIQLKYAMILTLVAASSSLILISVMGWFIQRNYDLFLGDELGVSAQVIEVVKHEQRLLELALFALFIVTTAIVFMVTFYVTRKLTGPMVAVQRQLWMYSEGDWSREFRLRRNDEFKELEVILNRVRQAHLTEIASHSPVPLRPRESAS